MYSWRRFACLRFWDASSCKWCYHSAWWPESIDSFMLRINLQHIQRKVYSQTGKQMISEIGSWTRDYLLLKIKLPCPSFILILFRFSSLVEFATGAPEIVKFFCLLSAMKCFIMVNKRASEQSDDFTYIGAWPARCHTNWEYKREIQDAAMTTVEHLRLWNLSIHRTFVLSAPSWVLIVFGFILG